MSIHIQFQWMLAVIKNYKNIDIVILGTDPPMSYFVVFSAIF